MGLGKFLKKASGLDFAKGLWNDFTGKSAVDAQNAANLKMWQMQNEYNTPANQMARYREAGLNPNLIYNEGQSTSAGNASSAPEMAAHQSGANQLMSLVSLLSGVVGVGKEVNDMQMEKLRTVSAIEHSKDVLDLEKKKMLIDNIFRGREFDFKVSNAQRDYKLKQAAHLLNLDKWNFEKDHILNWGTKPGTPTDLVNVLIGSVLGKSPVDVGTDAHNILNSLFSFGYKPVTWKRNLDYHLQDFGKNLLKDIVKGFSGNGYRR